MGDDDRRAVGRPRQRAADVVPAGEQHPVRAHAVGRDDEERLRTVDDPAGVVVLPSEVTDAPRGTIGVARRCVLGFVSEPRDERDRLAVRRPLEGFDLLGERDQRPHLAADRDRRDEQLRTALLAVTREREEVTVGGPAGVAVAVGTGAERMRCARTVGRGDPDLRLRTVRHEVGRREREGEERSVWRQPRLPRRDDACDVSRLHGGRPYCAGRGMPRASTESPRTTPSGRSAAADSSLAPTSAKYS